MDARLFPALSRALDARWKQTLRSVVDDGVWEGVFTCPEPAATVLRLAALMDGLAVQVALRDPDVSVARMAELWLTAASYELSVPLGTLLPPRTKPRTRRR